MGLFDFLFGNKKNTEQERQEQLRIQDEAAKKQSTISIRDVASGCAFNAHFTTIEVMKQPYNGESTKVYGTNNASVDIVRSTKNGIVNVSISTIDDLKSKGILQSNPSFNPDFNYSEQDGGRFQFAQAEINNSWAMMGSDQEYISLFSFTRQNGKLIAFLINNLPHVGDYYYLILFSE